MSSAEPIEDVELLPNKTLHRMMRRLLPNVKATTEARVFCQEAVSEFVLFICSEAADMALAAGRRSISGDDIIEALRNLGFDNYIKPLQVYLAKLREISKEQGDAIADTGDNAQL